MSTPVLELEQVRRVFDGLVPTVALDGVDLAVGPGEAVAVVGPSGSGKSTMLALAGALARPTSGRVLIGGTDVQHLRDRQLSTLRATQIGFVFQQFHLLEDHSALDNTAEGARYLGWSRRRRRAQAARLLGDVGLAHRVAHPAKALSGGERQRVAIARALMGDPVLLLADEPTGNLDSHAAGVVMALLRSQVDDRRGLVVITHDADLAASFPRTVRLRDGRIVGDHRNRGGGDGVAA